MSISKSNPTTSTPGESMATSALETFTGNGMTTEFYLDTFLPDEFTKIFIQGSRLHEGYQFEGDTVYFDFAPIGNIIIEN